MSNFQRKRINSPIPVSSRWILFFLYDSKLNIFGFWTLSWFLEKKLIGDKVWKCLSEKAIFFLTVFSSEMGTKSHKFITRAKHDKCMWNYCHFETHVFVLRLNRADRPQCTGNPHMHTTCTQWPGYWVGYIHEATEER